MNRLHRFLVPSQKNGYRPDSLEKAAATVMLVLILMTFAMANVQSILLVSSDWFVSSIIPAALVTMTNDERETEKLGVLSRSAVLDRAAQMKADDMAANSYFEHTSPSGVTPWHWFSEVGYAYAYAGENLAVHFNDSGDVVEAWMDSPGHRANIMNGRYTEIGIGTAKGTYKGSPTVFVVQLFGTPAEVPVRAPVTNQTEPVPELQPLASEANAPAVLAAENQSALVTPPHDPLGGVLVTRATPIEELFLDVYERENDILAQAVPRADARATTRLSELSTTSPANVAAPAISRTPQNPSLGARMGDMLYRFLSSPHLFLASIYLVLTFAVVTALVFAIVVEWRRQHPVQVAYGVGLMAAMFILMAVQLSLTSGAVVV